MNAMLPMILMSKKDSSVDNTKLMMLMLMQQPNAIRDATSFLPLILLKVKYSSNGPKNFKRKCLRLRSHD